MLKKNINPGLPKERFTTHKMAVKALIGGLGAALFVACLFLHSCKNPSGGGGNTVTMSGNAEFADSAMSVVRLGRDAQGHAVIEKNNTYYDLVDYRDKDGKKKMMLKTTKMETDLIESGASQSKFKISAISVADGKTAWTKECAGSDIDLTSKVVIVHTIGHSTKEEDTYVQYSLLTGEKLMAYTYAPLIAEIPNTDDGRFFGYLSGQSATDDKPEGLAQVSYVGGNKVIDKITIKVKDKNAAIPTYTPELRLRVVQESGNTVVNEDKKVILGRADGKGDPKDITNFSLFINFNKSQGKDSIAILLPVINDHVDIANARYDKTLFELVKAN